MGNRYWITGAQVGLLTGLLECDNWNDEMTLKEIHNLISTIQDEQFIGPQKYFEDMMMTPCKCKTLRSDGNV